MTYSNLTALSYSLIDRRVGINRTNFWLYSDRYILMVDRSNKRYSLFPLQWNTMKYEYSYYIFIVYLIIF